MNPFVILRDTFNVITRHPLNREHKLAAAVRYLRWQLGSLVAPGQIAVDFVDDTRLLGSFGMTSMSCNVYAGLYEFGDMAFVLHLLRESDLFVDVGANVGVYTVLAAGAAKASCVSLEPSPDTHDLLVSNVRLNGLGDRVQTLRVAAADREGETQFTRGLGAMNRIAVPDEINVCQVPLKTLNSIVGERPVTMLKIDVEGFETLVLRGADKVLQQPSLLAVLMETNGSGAAQGFDEALLHRTLVENGFTLRQYDPWRRQLVKPDKESAGDTGNSLYVRNLDLVQGRLSAAPRYRVHGHSL